jgi:hypothetical protein
MMDMVNDGWGCPVGCEITWSYGCLDAGVRDSRNRLTPFGDVYQNLATRHRGILGFGGAARRGENLSSPCDTRPAPISAWRRGPVTKSRVTFSGRALRARAREGG